MITEEKRIARRFRGRIGVYTRDDHGLNFGFITSLSRQGAYIETQKIAPLGASYHFVLSNGVITAPVTGRITRNRDAFFEGGTSGLAVEFNNLSSLSKRLRDDLLLYLMNNQHHDIWTEAPALSSQPA